MTKPIFGAGRSLAHRSRSYAGALACALLCTTALATAALPNVAAAQTAQAAPVRQSIDGNGVDLFRGTVNLDSPSLRIGPASRPARSWPRT